MNDAQRPAYAEIRARSRAVVAQSRKLGAEVRALCQSLPIGAIVRLEEFVAEVERVDGPRRN
jgi:hypothetical protein